MNQQSATGRTPEPHSHKTTPAFLQNNPSAGNHQPNMEHQTTPKQSAADAQAVEDISPLPSETTAGHDASVASEMDSEKISRTAKRRAEDLCRFLFPGGRRRRRRRDWYWVVGSPEGKTSRSLTIKITGRGKGKWRDGASKDMGTTLIQLWCWARECANLDEAAVQIKAWLEGNAPPFTPVGDVKMEQPTKLPHAARAAESPITETANVAKISAAEVGDAAKVVILDLDECARSAEIVHKKLNALGPRELALMQEAGEILCRVKVQADRKFVSILKQWKDDGLITFSHRSATRWMATAKHKDELKLANVANLNEAERYIRELKSKTESKTKAPANTGSLDKAVATAENYFLKMMRKLPDTDQKQLLQRLVEILSQRLEEFAS